MSRRGRGEGSIKLRTDGRWEARLMLPTGKRKSYFGATREAVEKNLREAQAARDEHRPIPGGKLTVEKYLKGWVHSLKIAGLASSTFVQYRSHVEQHLIPGLGKTPLVKLTAERLEQFYADKIAAGLSPTTVHHVHATLRRALNRAVRLDLVSRNVAQLAEAPQMAPKEMDTLTWPQLVRLMNAARGDRLEALIVLACTTGARQGELLGLRWRSVDLDAGALKITGSLARVPENAPASPKAKRLAEGFVVNEPKRRSRRTVQLVPRAIAALRDHRERQKQEKKDAKTAWHDFGLVFCTEIGTPIDACNMIRRSWHPILTLAGLPPISFHQLRHTVASLLLEQNTHPKIVSDLLGHQKTSTTLDIYSHVAPSLSAGVASLMGAKLDQVEAELGSELGSNSGVETAPPESDGANSTVH